jgi:hypothetical protein
VTEMSLGRETVLSVDAAEVAAVRTVVLASADAGLRQRLRTSLTGLRWQVREANGGAEAMAQLEDARSEALLVDSWLPDLEVGGFASVIRMMYPAMELLRVERGCRWWSAESAAKRTAACVTRGSKCSGERYGGVGCGSGFGACAGSDRCRCFGCGSEGADSDAISSTKRC